VRSDYRLFGNSVAPHNKQSIENKMVGDIEAGTLDRSWIDATLAGLQYFVEK